MSDWCRVCELHVSSVVFGRCEPCRRHSPTHETLGIKERVRRQARRQALEELRRLYPIEFNRMWEHHTKQLSKQQDKETA